MAGFACALQIVHIDEQRPIASVGPDVVGFFTSIAPVLATKFCYLEFAKRVTNEYGGPDMLSPDGEIVPFTPRFPSIARPVKLPGIFPCLFVFMLRALP